MKLVSKLIFLDTWFIDMGKGWADAETPNADMIFVSSITSSASVKSLCSVKIPISLSVCLDFSGNNAQDKI